MPTVAEHIDGGLKIQSRLKDSTTSMSICKIDYLLKNAKFSKEKY